MMNNTLYKLVLIPILSLSTIPAYAAISGEIAVKLNVDKGCEVTNSSTSGVAGDLNNFGTLDFGTVGPTWKDRLSAELVNPAITTGTATSVPAPLYVTCSSATDVNVRIDGGLRGDRTLKHPTEADTVAYKVYRDAARINEYAKDTNLIYSAVSTEPVPIPVYGAIAPNTTTGVANGAYTDTLIMTISF